METTRYPVSEAVATVVPVKATLTPLQSFGIFVSHLAAVAGITALGAAFVTVALFLLVVLAPVFVLVFVHLVRRHERLRLDGAAV